jgi:ferredoxin
MRYLSGVTTLTLAPAACTGCGRCVEVCPHAVLALDGRAARIVDRDRCMECGACRTNCPADAISVDVGVGCAAGMISEWLDDVLPRRFRRGDGCC